MTNVIYKIVLENTKVKYTNISNNVMVCGNEESTICNKIYINLTNKKNNGTLYVIHTEKKNRSNNIIYKDIEINIDENVFINVINLFTQNNNYNTIYYTILNVNLKKNSKVDSLLINNTRNYIKIKNTLDNDSILTTYYMNNGDILNTTIKNILCKNSILNFFTALQTKKNQKNFFNIKTTHIENNSYSKHVCRVVAHDNTKTTIKATITVKKNIKETNSDTTCKTITLGNDSTNTFMPFLKIFNNEIKCTHSASIGSIEKELIYYMKTRGLHKTTAYKIISRSFIRELFKEIKNIMLLNYLQNRYF